MAYSLPIQSILTLELVKTESVVVIVVIGELSVEKSVRRSSTLTSSQDENSIIIANR